MSERDDRQAHFDALYRDRPDPWGLATSDDERAKHLATLAALPRPNYGHALEVGCSIGVLTALLAGRCDHVTALDVSPVALAAARERCAGLSVTFVRCEVPRDWPAGPFDLAVFSEVLYFLDAAELREVARLAARDLSPGGTCLLVNWTGENDRPLDGAAAAQLFVDTARAHGLVQTGERREPLYRIDMLERA